MKFKTRDRDLITINKRVMKRVIYALLFSLIMVAGLLIQIVKGQEVRNKWISKMKFKHERKETKKLLPEAEVQLDEIELSTYHS